MFVVYVVKNQQICSFDFMWKLTGVEGRGEPGLNHEMLRRMVQNDVDEYWYYLRSQFTQLKEELASVPNSAYSESLKTLNTVIDVSADYTRLVSFRN
jgi:hypothetical protein